MRSDFCTAGLKLIRFNLRLAPHANHSNNNVATQVCKLLKHWQDGGMIAGGETASVAGVALFRKDEVAPDASTIIQMVG